MELPEAASPHLYQLLTGRPGLPKNANHFKKDVHWYGGIPELGPTLLTIVD